MDLFDPVLDKPQTIELSGHTDQALFPLANQDIRFQADSQADLHHLVWPWADREYARHIAVHITDLYDEAFMPLVTQSYPGYQETICGTEGMIVSKRLAAPMKSHYDRSIMWLLDCQAEGDRLLRVDVEIDWGEALTQRMVDGLLVAQRNPEDARGLYAQHNAESTRVFGNPQGRPTHVDLSNPEQARLTYHVLVNGMVEVALLLAISDVGEQVAWNGFLAQRDSGIIFEKGISAWDELLKTGRVWTPDPRLNRAVQAGRIETIRHVQRLRTGLAASDRLVERTPTLVASSDTFDVIQSRNLLAHLRRVADKGDGELPRVLPLRLKDPPERPGAETLWRVNSAYLIALAGHLRRHFDERVLDQHYACVGRVTDRLILARPDAHTLAKALDAAIAIAELRGDSVNLTRWQGEADLIAPPGQTERSPSTEPASLPQAWKLRDNGTWSYENPWSGIDFAGRAVWAGCGVQRKGEQIHITPRWPTAWNWWALLDLPVGKDRRTSLVWDGHALHATEPIVTTLPLAVHSRIAPLHTGEYEFALTFEFTDGAREKAYFRPEFLVG